MENRNSLLLDFNIINREPFARGFSIYEGMLIKRYFMNRDEFGSLYVEKTTQQRKENHNL